MNLQTQLYLSLSAILLLVHQTTLHVKGAKDCSNLKRLSYEFHGTKTIYSDALNYIQKNNKKLPKSFDDESLAKKHEELRKKSCTPMAFYFIGRHSARFPDADDIGQYNRDLSELIQKMKLYSNNCSKEGYKDLREWRSKMVPDHNNLITELGAQEERSIAQRFKKIYPEFFNTSSADIEIGVTKKLRTAQTGAQFLQEVDGLSLKSCDRASLPTNDVYKESYSLSEVLKAKCYQYLTDNYYQSFLEFHSICESISGEQKIKDPLIDLARNPDVLQRIANRVGKKLGFNDNRINKDSSTPVVNVQVLESIYNMCKFENALKNSSSWCNLFDEEDVQALEYIEDVKTYIKSAYGPMANPRQSCPLVSDLLISLSKAIKIPSTQDKKRSYFYFSHADPFKKLLSTFGLFRDDKSFSKEMIEDFVKDLSVPKNRNWRVSLITPFSANLAFVLYRWEKRDGRVKHRILSLVNEQPVELDGCGRAKCDSEKFFSQYGAMEKCNLNEICAKSG